MTKPTRSADPGGLACKNLTCVNLSNDHVAFPRFTVNQARAENTCSALMSRQASRNR